MSDIQLRTEGFGTVTPPDPDRPLPVHDLQAGDVVVQSDGEVRYTVVDDLGHSLLCARDDGATIEMNPLKLTKVDG